MKKFVLGYCVTLALALLACAAIVVPLRRRAPAEQTRFFVPQADPLFRASLASPDLDAAQLVVFGTSRAETGFNPSLDRRQTHNRALNFGTAGASLAGSAPLAEYLASHWARAGRDALFIVSEDELAFIEQRFGRYACFGAACFDLWRGAPPAEILKQQAAWVVRSARFVVGWDLRALGQGLLTALGRPRQTLTAEECARFDDHMPLDAAMRIPGQTYCVDGFTLNPTTVPPRPNASSPLPPWQQTQAAPMSGLNIIARQSARLIAKGAAATVVIFDAADRVVLPSTLAALRASVVGATICRYRPDAEGYSDVQHLSATGAARLTRLIAARARGARDTATPTEQWSCD